MVVLLLCAAAVCPAGAGAKKKGGVGRKVTGITKRTFRPNIQSVRAVVNGETKRVKVCVACIRSGRIQKPA